MAEESTKDGGTPTDAKPAPVTLSPEQVAEISKQAGQTVIAALQTLPRPEPEPAAAPPAADPVRDIVIRAMGPDFARMELAANSAQDAATFYRPVPANAPPEVQFDAALRAEYAQEIEADFQRFRQAGTPFDRETLWAHLKGKKMPEFFKRYEQFQQEQTQRAVSGVTPSGVPVGRQPQVIDPYTYTDSEELAKAMGDTQF